MTDETLQQDNPNPEPEPQEEDLHDAADALLGLMDEDGTDLQPSEQKDEPKAEPKAEEVKAEVKTEADEAEFEVTINGQKQKVKQTELLNGYQRQADATKKWQEASQMRAEADAKVQAAQTQYGQQLQNLMKQVEGAVQAGQLAPPNPALIDTDPVAFLRQKQQWENAQYAYQQASAQQQQFQTQAQQKAQADHQTFLAQQKEQLLAKLPMWADETKQKAEQQALTKYLVDFGYKPEEVLSTSDHKAVLLAYKAMQFDKLVAEQKAVVKNKVPAPQQKTAKSGAPAEESSPINKSAVQRLQRSGSLDDATAALASLMG